MAICRHVPCPAIVDAAVLVATMRAPKMRGGGPTVTPGPHLTGLTPKEGLPLLKNGPSNLGQTHHPRRSLCGAKLLTRSYGRQLLADRLPCQGDSPTSLTSGESFPTFGAYGLFRACFI